MTWKNPPPLQPTAKKAGKVVTPEQLAASGNEDGEQMAVFAWAAMNVGMYPSLKWLHAIPNGGQRHVAEATKMVAAGLRKGILDIFLPLPIQTHWANQYAGLYIELKIEKRRKEKNGGLTDEQIEFIEYAQRIGYYCAVCYSWIEARDILIKYLEGTL